MEVHRFYDEYYFRPKAVFRILKKAMFNSEDRKRLYKEAKAFLKTRAMRHKWVEEKRREGRLHSRRRTGQSVGKPSDVSQVSGAGGSGLLRDPAVTSLLSAA